MDTIETRKKNEQELKFDIIYSYYFEKFMNKFYSRLDKLILFILMVLAIITITGTSNIVLIGSVSAILIFVLIVSQAGARAQATKTIYQEYLKLYQNFDNIDIDTIKRRFRAIQEKENEEIDCLAYPAHVATTQHLGMTSDNGYKELHRKLSLLEKLYVLFIGETIEYEFKKESNPAA
ncbi:hypothetical protein BHC47_06090 [Snodgrassella alvi]|uniref:SMODS and SLOG-associating 2TM effector domain-containing protein n=1 Tax=Snodgrassella alvi TaxID=1196083 RepID=A0A2N9Y3M1_9NEIS|nr:hypothetical protein [Snodgrassella alvi]PIT61626.1 hypothetical protein BHC56_01120 [Snodgrassella alvi]PIT62058.1 hypothetical protein BHC47_06090 [Snodgrassella alvi]